MARVKYLRGTITYGKLFFPPLNSSLTLDEEKKKTSQSHTHKKKANHKTQPGHINTLMHLLALVKARAGGGVTPTLLPDHPLAVLLQPQASASRGDAAESPLC